jgi:hypothetical protein
MAITPVTLNPLSGNQYDVIGGMIVPADPIGNINNIESLILDPRINCVEARASWSNGLTFPWGGQGQIGYIGPDFGTDGSTSAVPEPATMLLLGSGLIGRAGFARNKFRK